jgi:hypothetical protein
MQGLQFVVFQKTTPAEAQPAQGDGGSAQVSQPERWEQGTWAQDDFQGVVVEQL